MKHKIISTQTLVNYVWVYVHFTCINHQNMEEYKKIKIKIKILEIAHDMNNIDQIF